MFHLYMSLFVALLFFVLTPGILLSLPAGGSKKMVAATHAVVFALVYHLTHKAVWNYFYGSQGFADASPASKPGMPSPPSMPVMPPAHM
jgi:hypothetical protein